MKTLFLIRHAKSDWGDPALPDHERPLAERGKRDLVTMGQRLAARGVKPDLIVSSPALRAITTARAIAGSLAYPVQDIVVDERVYEARAHDLLAVIQGLGEDVGSLMVFGHNPGFSELARHFAHGIEDMPTCAVAEFDFGASSWAGIGKASPARVGFDAPKRPAG